MKRMSILIFICLICCDVQAQSVSITERDGKLVDFPINLMANTFKGAIWELCNKGYKISSVNARTHDKSVQYRFSKRNTTDGLEYAVVAEKNGSVVNGRIDMSSKSLNLHLNKYASEGFELAFVVAQPWDGTMVFVLSKNSSEVKVSSFAFFREKDGNVVNKRIDMSSNSVSLHIMKYEYEGYDNIFSVYQPYDGTTLFVFAKYK